LDGITALTNTAPLQFQPIIVASNSIQANIIGAALNAFRINSSFGYFRDIGDILAVPELSLSSPFLNLTPSARITDEAYEKIPSQLLPRLRPDSIASIVNTSDGPFIQFTGWDAWQYVVEASSNLTDWIPVSTNTPSNGSFSFLAPPQTSSSSHRFFRSSLVP